MSEPATRIYARASSPAAVSRLRQVSAAEALAVEDQDGQRWVRLPEPFRGAQCQETARVWVGNELYEAECLQRALWVTSDGQARCADHIAPRMVLA